MTAVLKPFGSPVRAPAVILAHRFGVNGLGFLIYLQCSWLKGLGLGVNHYLQ